MKTITINAYNYNELSAEAKQNVIDAHREDCARMASEVWGDDHLATINKFCELMCISIKSYSVDECSYDYSFSVNNLPAYQTEHGYILVSELSGKLLACYMNEYVMPALSRCYSCRFGKSWQLSIQKVINDCPLTGVCYDCDILAPIIEAYNKGFSTSETYSELIDKCLDSLFSAWQKEYEWWKTDEYVEEWIEANLEDVLFDEYGNELNIAQCRIS